MVSPLKIQVQKKKIKSEKMKKKTCLLRTENNKAMLIIQHSQKLENSGVKNLKDKRNSSQSKILYLVKTSSKDENTTELKTTGENICQQIHKN